MLRWKMLKYYGYKNQCFTQIEISTAYVVCLYIFKWNTPYFAENLSSTYRRLGILYGKFKYMKIYTLK